MPEYDGHFDVKKESLFWLGILRDHSEFMYLAFPASEKADSKEAQYYMGVFADLRKRVAGSFSGNLLPDIRNRVTDFRKYQQDVLMRQLTCSVVFNLPPLILEHTIAEAGEFILILDEVIPEKNMVLQDMHEHLLWLWDFTGHADLVLLQLDPTEEIIIAKAREFKALFMALLYKAYSYQKMIKPRPECLPNLRYFNRQASTTSQDFMDYMAKLKSDVAECRVLGILPVLLLDHMIRETRYYLGKIHADCQDATDEAPPIGDANAALSVPRKKPRLWPAKPRVS